MLGIRHHRKAAIDLFQGDITGFVCDAMGNAANAALAGDGGVDGAIRRVGGPALIDACSQIGGCQAGRAVVTPAGNLPAQWVIHAVGPIWQGGEANEDQLLRSAYLASLREAALLNVRHLALPSISTGVYGFPVARAALVALNAVRSFLDDQPEGGALRRITFVLFSANDYAAYQSALFTTFSES